MTPQHNQNDEHGYNHSHQEDEHDDHNHSKDNALSFAFWINLAQFGIFYR